MMMQSDEPSKAILKTADRYIKRMRNGELMMRDPMIASLWHDMAPAHVKHVKTLDEYKAVVG